ncbi:MAG: hypothetical protein WBD81_18020 [Collimonas pratensis]|uniref:hypothetical protein n=1 Tax=Collimonas pratensis TaxID=279113 RepID=UPI003C7221DC
MMPTNNDDFKSAGRRRMPPGFAQHFAGHKMDSPEMAPIKPPEGFDLQGKGPGDTVQAVVEFEVTDDGMLMPKTINGISLDGGEMKPFEDADDQGAFAGQLKSAPGGGDEEAG